MSGPMTMLLKLDRTPTADCSSHCEETEQTTHGVSPLYSQAPLQPRSAIAEVYHSECNVMSMWSLRWHFTNKSVTRALCSSKGYSYSLLHSQTLRWKVRWLKYAVPSWGRGGTAAAMAQNEQTLEEHSTLEQQSARRLDHPAWCVVTVRRLQLGFGCSKPRL